MGRETSFRLFFTCKLQLWPWPTGLLCFCLYYIMKILTKLCTMCAFMKAHIITDVCWHRDMFQQYSGERYRAIIMAFLSKLWLWQLILAVLFGATFLFQITWRTLEKMETRFICCTLLRWTSSFKACTWLIVSNYNSLQLVITSDQLVITYLHIVMNYMYYITSFSKCMNYISSVLICSLSNSYCMYYVFTNLSDSWFLKVNRMYFGIHATE